MDESFDETSGDLSRDEEVGRFRPGSSHVNQNTEHALYQRTSDETRELESTMHRLLRA